MKTNYITVQKYTNKGTLVASNLQPMNTWTIGFFRDVYNQARNNSLNSAHMLPALDGGDVVANSVVRVFRDATEAYGICVGTSDNSFDFEQTLWPDQIRQGTASGQLTYLTHVLGNRTDMINDNYYEAYRDFRNDTSENITVKEICILAGRHVTTPVRDNSVLFARDILEVAQVLAPTEVLRVRYRIESDNATFNKNKMLMLYRRFEVAGSTSGRMTDGGVDWIGSKMQFSSLVLGSGNTVPYSYNTFNGNGGCRLENQLSLSYGATVYPPSPDKFSANYTIDNGFAVGGYIKRHAINETGSTVFIRELAVYVIESFGRTFMVARFVLPQEIEVPDKRGLVFGIRIKIPIE